AERAELKGRPVEVRTELLGDGDVLGGDAAVVLEVDGVGEAGGRSDEPLSAVAGGADQRVGVVGEQEDDDLMPCRGLDEVLDQSRKMVVKLPTNILAPHLTQGGQETPEQVFQGCHSEQGPRIGGGNRLLPSGLVLEVV